MVRLNISVPTSSTEIAHSKKSGLVPANLVRVDVLNSTVGSGFGFIQFLYKKNE